MLQGFDVKCSLRSVLNRPSLTLAAKRLFLATLLFTVYKVSSQNEVPKSLIEQNKESMVSSSSESQMAYKIQINEQSEKENNAKEREKNLVLVLFISFFIIGIIVFLLCRNLRNGKIIKSTNAKLELLTENLKASYIRLETTLNEVNNKNEIIELKNRQILESIVYAKRIQHASLPTMEDIQVIAKDSFVLYKPKDIISGDFYVVSSLKNITNSEFTVYVVGDCTGHGVPGAMLSMLSGSLVKQAIKKQGISSPAAILMEVNKLLVKFFRHRNGENFKDGMDIACYIIDKEKNKLHFSGAGRPLLCIREDAVIELKGEKQHLGFSDKEFKLSDQELEVKQGDSIYLFSDGYSDQLHWKTKKRLMSKNFKSLLLSIQEEPMEKQGDVLKNYFEEWRGDHVQMDDVCILGIKI